MKCAYIIYLIAKYVLLLKKLKHAFYQSNMQDTYTYIPKPAHNYATPKRIVVASASRETEIL